MQTGKKLKQTRKLQECMHLYRNATKASKQIERRCTTKESTTLSKTYTPMLGTKGAIRQEIRR